MTSPAFRVHGVLVELRTLDPLLDYAVAQGQARDDLYALLLSAVDLLRARGEEDAELDAFMAVADSFMELST